MLNILTVPDKRLREISQPIAEIDKKLLDFVEELKDTLKGTTNPPGVGLSGVQVGKLIRGFVTYLPKKPGLPAKFWNDKTLEMVAYINPEIVSKSRKMTLGGKRGKPFMEGCLSIPSIYGPVYRHEWVKLKWQNEAGDGQNKKFSGFPARVIQHEMDHLNGILFTDYSLKDKLPIYEEKGDELVEIEL